MSGYENKYEPLYDFLMKETRDDFVLTYEEIEEILGFDLPRSAAFYRRQVHRAGFIACGSHLYLSDNLHGNAVALEKLR